MCASSCPSTKWFVVHLVSICGPLFLPPPASLSLSVFFPSLSVGPPPAQWMRVDCTDVTRAKSNLGLKYSAHISRHTRNVKKSGVEFGTVTVVHPRPLFRSCDFGNARHTHRATLRRNSSTISTRDTRGFGRAKVRVQFPGHPFFRRATTFILPATAQVEPQQQVTALPPPTAHHPIHVSTLSLPTNCTATVPLHAPPRLMDARRTNLLMRRLLQLTAATFSCPRGAAQPTSQPPP